MKIVKTGKAIERWEFPWEWCPQERTHWNLFSVPNITAEYDLQGYWPQMHIEEETKQKDVCSSNNSYMSTGRTMRGRSIDLEYKRSRPSHNQYVIHEILVAWYKPICLWRYFSSWTLHPWSHSSLSWSEGLQFDLSTFLSPFLPSLLWVSRSISIDLESLWLLFQEISLMMRIFISFYNPSKHHLILVVRNI